MPDLEHPTSRTEIGPHGIIFADNPLTQLTRLVQINAGTPVLADDGSGEIVSLEMPSAKVSGLLELIEEAPGEPLVIFTHSRKLAELVVRELRKHKRKLRVVEITGNVTGEDRTEAVRKFQESEADYCVFTMGAGGEGITLTRASRVVFLQRSFSLVQNKQAEDRLHRIGQEAESVQVIDIIAADTIDADVREALVVKGVKFEEVVRDEDTLRAILRRKAAFS